MILYIDSNQQRKVYMELKQHPVTELEYWQAIEELGGFIWRMNHDLADGRIKDPEGGIAKDISDAVDISSQLVKEIGEKFGVIPPEQTPKVEQGQERPPAPDGKTYYWDWYHKWERVFFEGEYEKIICSACPMSEGVDSFIRLGQIPCSVFPGAIYRLQTNYQCDMLRTSHAWTTQRLHSTIFNKGGHEALKIFKDKQAQLVAAAEQSTA